MPDLNIIARPHALRAAQILGGVPLGLTLAEIVETVYDRGHVAPESRRGAVVMVNGEIVSPSMWRCVRPKEAAHVQVSLPLRGGGSGNKNPIATVLSLVVIVVATYFGQVYAAPWASGAFGAGSFAASAVPVLATAALPMAGAVVVASLTPPKGEPL